MSTSLKNASQNFLKSLGLYQRIKSSMAYNLYWRLANPRLIEERESELEFFKRTLRGFKAGDLIFDVGANRGHKTDIFLRLGARVVAVDPDATNQQILRESFLELRWAKKPVVIVGKAVSERNGVETMWVDAPGSAKNTLNRKWVETLQMDGERFGRVLQFGEKIEVPTVTLEELIREHGRPFYIKIDVEGHEPSALRGLHTVVPYISFEVNLPEFTAEAVECVNRLEGLHAGGHFNYSADCSGEMDLPDWLDACEFSKALGDCMEPSIEVFWKSVG